MHTVLKTYYFYPACPVKPGFFLTGAKLFFYFTGAIISIGVKPLSYIYTKKIILKVKKY